MAQDNPPRDPMPDDDDDNTFIRSRIGTLTTSAWLLHSFALVNSTDGIVPDSYLNNIEAATTAQALELELAGLWGRVDGGYRLHDEEALGWIASFKAEEN